MERRITDFFKVTKEDEGKMDECKDGNIGDPLPLAPLLVCFTDGSCFGNGQHGKHVKAGYSVVFPDHGEYTGGWKLIGHHLTNNRAEYMGLLKAFEHADAIDPSKRRQLVVYTDSELLVNTINKWMTSWKRKGWIKFDGKPVKNLDLVKQIDTQLSLSRSIVVRHVKAHTGRKDFLSENNNIADKLARNAALS